MPAEPDSSSHIRLREADGARIRALRGVRSALSDRPKWLFGSPAINVRNPDLEATFGFRYLRLEFLQRDNLAETDLLARPLDGL